MSSQPDEMAPMGGMEPLGNGTPVAPAAPPPVAQPMYPAPAPLAPPQGMPGAPASRFDTLPAPASRFNTASAPMPGAAPASRFDTPAASPRLADPVAYRPPMSTYQGGAADELTPGRAALGILAGIFAGTGTLFLWVGFYMLTHLAFSIIGAIGLGYAVGWAVYQGTGQGEAPSCWIGGVIAFLFSVLGVIAIQVLSGFSVIYLIFGLLAIGYGTSRGFRTPAVLAFG